MNDDTEKPGGERAFPIALITPASILRLLCAFPIGCFFLPVIAILLAFFNEISRITGTQVSLLLPVALLTLLPFPLVVFASRLHTVRLTNETLSFRGLFAGCSEPLATLQIDNARVMDLRVEGEFRPARKTWGTDVPGCYSCGFGTLRNKEKACWLLTDAAGVVYVPSAGGRAILVSVRNPEEMIATLKSYRTGQPFFGP